MVDDNENPLANAAAQTTTDERTIEENENPLAGPASDSDSAFTDESALGGANWLLVVGVGAFVVVAVAAVAHVLYHRRKNGQDQTKTQA